MGTWVTFECARCQYRAQVSGGDDSGMVVDTTTILCVQCREIFDVVTHSRKTNRDKKIRCPKDAKHEVRRWTSSDICPRCGDPGMGHAEDGEMTLWD